MGNISQRFGEWKKKTRKIVLLEVLDVVVLYTSQGWVWTATESYWIPKGQICEDAQSASTNGRTRVATGVWRQTSLSENGSGVLHQDTTDGGNSDQEVITRRVWLPYWAFSTALSWIVLNLDCFSVTFPVHFFSSGKIHNWLARHLCTSENRLACKFGLVQRYRNYILLLMGCWFEMEQKFAVCNCC